LKFKTNFELERLSNINAFAIQQVGSADGVMNHISSHGSF